MHYHNNTTMYIVVMTVHKLLNKELNTLSK